MKIFTLSLLAFTLSPLLSATPLKLDLDKVTVSGLSSGGYMATQFHIAHSNWVSGAGIIAAGPYYCGQNSIAIALGQCVNKQDQPVDLAALTKQTKQWQKEGKIAPLSNLKQAKVWLFHGSKDSKVIEPVSDGLYAQYQQWSDNKNIRYIKDRPFAHHFPTLKAGTDCSQSSSPFLGQCDYDGAGEMLSFILSPTGKRAQQMSGKLISIDQQKLGGEPAEGLADEGYAYIPKDCASGSQCRIHINFHGCNQFAGAVGTEYVNNNGLNQWADNNQLIVLYPQTKASMLMPLNPQGCWDWWGYTGDDYATRGGKQITAVENITRALNGMEIN